MVVFPITKFVKLGPEQLGQVIGEYLVEHCDIVVQFNVVKGFLNLVIEDGYWKNAFIRMTSAVQWGWEVSNTKPRIMVEYSSPNTNKPLHLGHLRNNFLGYSVAEILKAAGHKVTKVQIINDRGIHICKSMYAWQHAGKNETPESTGLKGDKLVGQYYVAFDQQYKAEIAELIQNGMSKEEAESKAPSMLAAQEMLRKWENGDEEVTALFLVHAVLPFSEHQPRGWLGFRALVATPPGALRARVIPQGFARLLRCRLDVCKQGSDRMHSPARP